MAVAGESENNIYLSNIKVLSEDKYNALSSTPDNVLHFVELPMECYVIETYKQDSSWYRIWSDGTVEQGGKVARTAATQLVSFLIDYTSEPNIFISAYHTAAGTDGRPPLIYSPSTDSFTLSLYTGYAGVYWYAIGK